jgi:HD-GYP domain-containing protein (c-di-GMP phosphodiesterase class II)
MHELGRLEGHTSEPTELAARGARMLAEAGFPDGIVSAIRHMHERWDGTGGPDGLAASRIPFSAQVLGAADSIDHYWAAWVQAGSRTEDAAARALALVKAQQGSLFSSMVIGAIDRAGADVRQILSEELADASLSGIRNT